MLSQMTSHWKPKTWGFPLIFKFLKKGQVLLGLYHFLLGGSFFQWTLYKTHPSPVAGIGLQS